VPARLKEWHFKLAVLPMIPVTCASFQTDYESHLYVGKDDGGSGSKRKKRKQDDSADERMERIMQLVSGTKTIAWLPLGCALYLIRW